MGLFGGSDVGVDIKNSYASGNVTAAAGVVGGFIGRTSSNNPVDTSYSIGIVTNTFGDGGAFVGTNGGAASYSNNFYNSDIDHSIGGNTADPFPGISGLSNDAMQSACTADQISNDTGICALGNAFRYGNNSYPKLYRLNPDGTISTKTLLGGEC